MQHEQEPERANNYRPVTPLMVLLAASAIQLHPSLSVTEVAAELNCSPNTLGRRIRSFVNQKHRHEQALARRQPRQQPRERPQESVTAVSATIVGDDGDIDGATRPTTDTTAT